MLFFDSAVHLQDANAKFHKLVYCSGEVHFIFVQQIYSGMHVPNLIRIGWVLQNILQKHFGVFFRFTM